MLELSKHQKERNKKDKIISGMKTKLQGEWENRINGKHKVYWEIKSE